MIDGIDKCIAVDRVASSTSRAVVKAGAYCGLSANIEGRRTPPDFPALRRKSLKEVAELCKSWDFSKAVIGASTVNAYYNSARFLPASSLPANNTFYAS